MLALYMALSTNGIAGAPIGAVSLEDIEYRCNAVGTDVNFNFNTWAAWLKDNFPEITKPAIETDKNPVAEQQTEEPGEKDEPKQDSSWWPLVRRILAPAPAGNWADSCAKAWMPPIFVVHMAVLFGQVDLFS